MKHDINLNWSDYSAGLLCDAFQHVGLSLTTAGSLCDAFRHLQQHVTLCSMRASHHAKP